MLFPLSIYNEQHIIDHTDGIISVLIFAVLCIINLNAVFIFKDKCRCFKCNSMLLLIDDILGLIPLKDHNISPRPHQHYNPCWLQNQ